MVATPTPFDLPSALREFARLQVAWPDPRIAAWSASRETSDPRMAVLAASVSQDLSIPAVGRLLADLSSRLGPALLEPWRIRQDELDKVCQLPWLHAWPHREVLSGWITATGDFLRAHDDPSRWASTWPEPRDFVRALALRIPWMGRKSTERVKGWRLARWLVRGEGLAAPLWPDDAMSRLRVPHPVLSVPLSWFGRLPAGWESRGPRERQAWTDSVIARIDPVDPAAVWVSLESILRRGKLDHLCVERVGSCEACPLRAPCKG